MGNLLLSLNIGVFFLALIMFNILIKFAPLNYCVVFHHIAHHVLFIHSLHDIYYIFQFLTIVSNANEHLNTHLFFSNETAVSRAKEIINYNSGVFLCIL